MSAGDMESSPEQYIVRPSSLLCFRYLQICFIDGGEDLEKVIVAAYQRYCVSNPIHPDVFPAVRKMEAEIVAMCLRMYNNPDGAGAMTSGGTESIIMAIKTHRDWAHAVKGITEPEMYVIPLLRYGHQSLNVFC
jgi:glutamate/tyrosine decarboxylase-like PLP-dependent enzyme